MRKIVWFTVVILLTLGGMLLLWEFRAAVVLFAFSLALSAVFRPTIETLERRGLPRLLAIGIAYLFGLGILALFFYLAGPRLVRDLQRATDNFAVYYNHVRRVWAQGSPFQQAIAVQLPPQESLYDAIAGEEGAALLQTILGFATNIFGIVFSLVVVLMLSIYWSIDRVHFERIWLATLPAARRVRARTIWREIESGVGDYLRSELIQGLIVASLLGVAYRLLGLEYSMLLALFATLAWLIPWLGSVLALIPPLLVGSTESLAMGVLAALITLGVLLFLEVIVEPRLFNRRRFSSLLIVLLLIAMGDAFGLLGIIFAPPLAAAVQILLSHLMGPSRTEIPLESPEQIQRLKEMLEKVRDRAANLPDPPAQITSLTERLNRLISRSEKVLQSRSTPNNS